MILKQWRCQSLPLWEFAICFNRRSGFQTVFCPYSKYIKRWSNLNNTFKIGWSHQVATHSFYFSFPHQNHLLFASTKIRQWYENQTWIFCWCVLWVWIQQNPNVDLMPCWQKKGKENWRWLWRKRTWHCFWEPKVWVVLPPLQTSEYHLKNDAWKMHFLLKESLFGGHSLVFMDVYFCVGCWMHLCFRMPSAYLTTLLLNNDIKVGCDYTNLWRPHIIEGDFQRDMAKGTLGRVPSQLFPKYYTMLPYTTII